MRPSLRESLAEWSDWDGAAYSLAVCLGLMPEGIFPGRAKHVFWSNHEIGEMLFGMLDRLVEAGVLEERNEPDMQYRWRSDFRGSWEPEA